jgi:Cu+-exporting ATPase
VAALRAAAALALPVFALSMGEMIGWHAHPWINWCSRPVVLWAGAPFTRAWASLHAGARHILDRSAPASPALCIVATLAPQLTASARGHGGAVAVYFEAAAVITALVLLGQVLELRARSRTGSAIRAAGAGAEDRAPPHTGRDHERDVPWRGGDRRPAAHPSRRARSQRRRRARR